MTCLLKVTREVPSGLMRIIVDPIFIDDLFIHLTLFYRYTGGFRPYLLDFTFDVCALLRKKDIIFDNQALMRLVSSFKKAFPSLFTGCPYKVGYFLTKCLNY